MQARLNQAEVGLTIDDILNMDYQNFLAFYRRPSVTELQRYLVQSINRKLSKQKDRKRKEEKRLGIINEPRGLQEREEWLLPRSSMTPQVFAFDEDSQSVVSSSPDKFKLPAKMTDEELQVRKEDPSFHLKNSKIWHFLILIQKFKFLDESKKLEFLGKFE